MHFVCLSIFLFQGLLCVLDFNYGNGGHFFSLIHICCCVPHVCCADEPTIASDYKTEAEAGGGFKKKTKKPKKRLRAKSVEPEEEGVC